MDDGRQNRAQQHQQDRIANPGEKGLYPVKGRKRLHGAAHEFQSHEQQAESGEDAAQRLGTAFLGKEAQECAQSGKRGEDDAGGQRIATRATICAVIVVPMLAP